MATKFFLMILTIFIITGCGGGSVSNSTTQQHSNEKTRTKSPTTQTPTTHATELKGTSKSHTTIPQKDLKQIDLLVLVDAEDADSFNGKTEAKIEHFISVTNKIYQNSALAATFNVVKVSPYTFTTDNGTDALFNVYDDKNISTLKENVQADLVVIYRKFNNVKQCGIAFVNNHLDKDSGYAHVALECPSTTTAHEIGHAMGLTHSQAQGERGGSFNYARGYGVDGVFSTIMAYGSAYNASVEVLNYSSPELEYEGYACGAEEGTDDEADAARALRNVIDRVADFR